MQPVDVVLEVLVSEAGAVEEEPWYVLAIAGTGRKEVTEAVQGPKPLECLQETLAGN